MDLEKDSQAPNDPIPRRIGFNRVAFSATQNSTEVWQV